MLQLFYAGLCEIAQGRLELGFRQRSLSTGPEMDKVSEEFFIWTSMVAWTNVSEIRPVLQALRPALPPRWRAAPSRDPGLPSKPPFPSPTMLAGSVLMSATADAVQGGVSTLSLS